MDGLLDNAKGKMNEMPNKVKGQHIEKVNELDEKNKRLKMYNQDLRCEVVEEELNSQTTIPPDLGDKNVNEGQDCSSNLAADNYMEPACFLTNVLVMDKIFGYLDVKELKECRLICKDWNKATSSILSKRNNGNGLAVNLVLEVQGFPYHADSDNLCRWIPQNGYVEDDDLEKSRELHSIMEAASENWFRMVNLDDNYWTRYAFKSVFQDFGNRLKVINVASEDLHFPTLRSILLDWCPNLEQLGLPRIKFETDRELVINRPLKLTRLTFNVSGFYESFPFEDVAEVLFTIIKNSPNLKKLESFGCYTKVANRIFSKLQNDPQIMNNLEEIFCTNASFGLMQNEYTQDPLEALSNIQFFESKLKQLVLTDIKPGHCIALYRLLNMTNESLEKLTLISHTGHNLPAAIELPDFQLKQMNCLRKFIYHADRNGPMNSIDNLGKMPNLKVFELKFKYTFVDGCRDGLIDRMFSNCRQLMRNPHQNLKELHLHGNIQKPLDTFDVIGRGFPNLNKLVLGIDPKEQENYEDFSDLFKGISKLKQLNKLFLDLNTFQCHLASSQKIKRIFSDFEKLPNLIHLTMRWGELDFEEALFCKLPKLQRLTLMGVKMDPIKARNLGEILDKRGIFLDLKDR